MSTTVLASRLRALERAGVVRRGVLPPPAASAVYELTDYGRDLGPILLGLCRWGVRSLEPRVEESFHSNWLSSTLKAHFHPDAAGEQRRVYELRLRDGPFRLTVADGDVSTAKGAAEDADLVLEADDDALVGLLAGQVSLEAALAGGAVAVVSGAAGELRRFLELFRFADPVAA
jgi:putative sterol carrier protein